MKNKYGNKWTVIDGIRFQSKGEGLRYLLLKDRERCKEIRDLKRQVTFALYGKNGSPVCRCRMDFLYSEDGKMVAEDYKGFETPDFKIKAKLFQDNYPDIELRVVR